mmetsp:Transcript_15536/g.20164  ORF Transcript_15536/g.20164 Transcript_15536/m.20164 type:complete len:383 (+) Transcript_15536:43-1191(+)
MEEKRPSWPVSIHQKYRETVGMLISGGVAGCVAKTVTAPLSRLTILFQVHSMVTTKPHAPQYADSMIGAFRKVVGKEGFLAFWKGNGTSVVHRFPYSAINFTIFESSKLFLISLFGYKKLEVVASDKMGLIRFISGAIAGGTATATCYPLDLVRTRLTTQVAETPQHYNGIVHALVRIARDEGFRGLYNGLGITLLVQVPNLAISYASYGFFRDAAMEWLHQRQLLSYTQNDLSLTDSNDCSHQRPIQEEELGNTTENTNNNHHQQQQHQQHQKSIQMGINMTCGALSGICATLIIYPLDVIRRRMQLQGLHRPKELRNNAFIEIHTIIKSEGISGLYRGLTPEICKIVPMVSITFCVYELLKEWFEIENKENIHFTKKITK